MRVDKVADVPLDGQEAETSAPSGALGAVIELSVAHEEVLDATSGDIDFHVRLGNAATAASASGDSCPADYRVEGAAEAGPAAAPAPAPAPGSSAPGARQAATAITLLSAALGCLMGALLL